MSYQATVNKRYVQMTLIRSSPQIGKKWYWLMRIMTQNTRTIISEFYFTITDYFRDFMKRF